MTTATREIFRFYALDDVQYGEGSTLVEATNEAHATLGTDANGYVVVVDQEQDEAGDWEDITYEFIV